MRASHRLRLALWLALPGAMAACVPMPTFEPPPYIQTKTTFDEASLRQQLEPGHSTITGQAFTRTVGGEVRYGAGVPILLVPVDAYVEECMQIVTYGRSDCSENLKKLHVEATADGEGRFKFQNLRPGKWYVEATIKWGVPSAYGVQETGGTFHNTVDIPADGDAVEALIH